MKYALITGATGTLGSALVAELTNQYQHFFLLGRNIQKLEALDDQLKSNGCTTTLIPQDFTQPFDPTILVNHIREKTHALHFFAACAVTHGKARPFQDVKLENWFQTHQINFSINVLLIKLLLPFLQEADQAHLLFPSCRFLPAYDAAYTSSKAALETLIENIAKESTANNLKWCLFNTGLMRSPLAHSLFPGEKSENFLSPHTQAKQLIKRLLEKEQPTFQKINLDEKSSTFAV